MWNYREMVEANNQWNMKTWSFNSLKNPLAKSTYHNLFKRHFCYYHFRVLLVLIYDGYH